MARIFQLSTQSGRSLPNARLALDTPRSLDPIREVLYSSGLEIPAGTVGHAWAFSPNTRLVKPPAPLTAGDLALRIEPGQKVRRLYEVLAFLPNRPELSQRVNHAPWRGGGAPYPHFVAFKPSMVFGERAYSELIETLASDDFKPEPRYPAKFIPFDAQRLLSVLGVLGATVSDPVPDSLNVPDQKRTGQRRVVETRDGGPLFRQQVFNAYRVSGLVSCAACGVTDERVLESAHVIDYGYVDDGWWNGLPMCRNHHRLFDLSAIMLEPVSHRWVSQDDLLSLGVTRTGLDHLPSAPHKDAVAWRWEIVS